MLNQLKILIKKLKDNEVEEEINKAEIKQLKEEKDSTKDKDKKKKSKRYRGIREEIGGR